MALFPLILTAFGLSSAAAAGALDLRALEVLPDSFALEIAMERARINPREASALYGESTLGSRVDGSPVEIAALGWLRLDGVSVIDPADTRGAGARRACAKLKGHDPVPGLRRVVPVGKRRGGLAPAEATDAPPTLILANGEQGEYALVQLQPGDVLQVTDVEYRGDRMEHIEVRRGVQRLTVDRRGNGAAVCYEPNVELPPEWMPD